MSLCISLSHLLTTQHSLLSRSVPRAKSHSHPHLVSSGFTPLSPPRAPQPTLISPDHTRPGPRGLSQPHLKSQPKPWSERTPTALGTWIPPEIMWPAHDNHTTMCHSCHLVSRPPSQRTWDLRVPTLFPFNLFLSYCVLMLL